MTAIILGDNGCFLILYGDHQTALDGRSRDEAVAYWKAHPELCGFTSDNIED